MRKTLSRQAQAKKVAWASWIGSALEYYDFFLYGTAAVLFLGPLYFPSSAPGVATLAAVASVGAGYISRPLGAVVLGYLGDAYGRRRVLLLTLLLMGASTVLIGALPTYQEIGLAAPLLLIGLRLLQGLAVSGEQASVNTLLIELSDKDKRGLYTSFALSGAQAGFILASVVFMLLSVFLSEADLMAWGWRIPFLLSVILIALGLWLRFRLPESPGFLSEGRRADRRPEPLKTLWTFYKREIFCVVLATQVSVAASVVTVFSLSWAVNHSQLPRPTMLGVLIASAVVGIFAAPAWACLSDRVGRRPVFMLGALASGLLIWPYLWAISQSNIPLIFAFGVLLAGVAYNAANGVWPSLYGEMFSTRIRLSGMAISTQIGFMVSAQAPTLAAFLTRNSPSEWTPVALLVSASCSISLLAVFFSPETSQVELADLGKKASCCSVS